MLKCKNCNQMMNSKCPFYRNIFNNCGHNDYEILSCDMVCDNPINCPDQDYINSLTENDEVKK